jgi:hypothetical protein
LPGISNRACTLPQLGARVRALRSAPDFRSIIPDTIVPIFESTRQSFSRSVQVSGDRMLDGRLRFDTP